MRFTERILALLGRRRAYTRCFHNDEGELTEEARIVLGDLMRFCRVNRSTVVVSPVTRVIDTHASMVAEGRREVFNRIVMILRVTDEQIMASGRDQKDESND